MIKQMIVHRYNTRMIIFGNKTCVENYLNPNRNLKSQGHLYCKFCFKAELSQFSVGVTFKFVIVHLNA